MAPRCGSGGSGIYWGQRCCRRKVATLEGASDYLRLSLEVASCPLARGRNKFECVVIACVPSPQGSWHSGTALAGVVSDDGAGPQSLFASLLILVKYTYKNKRMNKKTNEY